MPLISIVIPAYNAQNTILETIQSVQKQTFTDFELIVINNGSTDQTLKLLNNIQKPCLKIFSYQENAKVAMARNRGISQAKGEFIAFLDADDIWAPDKLELQLTALRENPEAGLAYSWTCNMDEKGENFASGHHVTFEGNVYAQLLAENFIAHGSNPLIPIKVIEMVGEFDPTLAASEDWEYWLRIAAKWSFVVVPKEQIFYRQSSRSLTSKVEIMQEGSLVVLERAFQSAPAELQSLKNQCLANIYLYTAELYLRYRNTIEDIKKSVSNLQKAIYLSPQNIICKLTRKLLI